MRGRGGRQPIAVGLDPRRFSKQDKEDLTRYFWPRIHKGAPGDCWRFGTMRASYLSFRRPNFYWRGQHYNPRHLVWVLLKGRLEVDKYLWPVCGMSNCVNPDHMQYGDYEDLERWDAARPRLTPEQVIEARHLYSDGAKLYELRNRYQLTDREMRHVLNL
jgi:hypothetical protein